MYILSEMHFYIEAIRKNVITLYTILNGIPAEGEMQISSEKVKIINKIHEVNFVNY